VDAQSSIEMAIESNKVSHAYIIKAGDKEAQASALFLAKGVNCLSAGQKPCGVCPSCRKISLGNHPDVSVAEAGSSIGIDDIRQLQKEIFKKPYEGRKRVSIIRQGERMTVQAQNCLLKVLEDPPGDGIIVITTDCPDNLLPTIISRCQVLKAKAGRSVPDYNVYRETVACIMEEEFTKASAAIDTLVKDKERSVEDFLDCFLMQLRDILVLKVAQNEDLLYIKDNGEFARRAAARFSPGKLARLLEAVTTARENLRQNVNAQLAVEVLLLEIQEV
jgi:DNA polymerase-3 subunit delta'